MKLFEPIQIKGMELKNRVVMPPMGTNLADNKGYVTPRMIAYYEQRAKGEVGLITIEATVVEARGRIMDHNLSLFDDSYTQGFKLLADTLHRYGAKVSVQLMHGGRECSPAIIGTQPISASANPPAMSRLADLSLGERPREMTLADINQTLESYAQAAKRAKEAGLDALEVLLGHRTLPEQFLLADSNNRTDEYGGIFENRARFLCQIVSSIRHTVGDNFPISCRIPASEYPEGGYTEKEIFQLIKMLEQAGADIFNVSVVVSRKLVNVIPMCFPPGSLVPLAEKVKKVTNKPIITFGRINDPLLAERILQEGKADLIAMGRPLIADPEILRKTLEGHLEDIRKCIACNKGCVDRAYGNQTITCTLNAQVGREQELPLKSAQVRKRVVIVGGGPGGMEAARVAALRGHEAILFEKESELGGQLSLAKIPPHKEGLDSILQYYQTQLSKLGVEIHLGEEIRSEDILALSPDIVIVASGSIPLIPLGIEIDNRRVLLYRDVLEGKPTGKKVAVIGGGLVGVETAELLADQGKEVLIVEMLDKVALDLGPIARMFQKQRLEQKNVTVMTNTIFESLANDGIWVRQDHERIKIPVDTVVIAVGLVAKQDFCDLLDKNLPIYFLGDRKEPRSLLEAIHEGYHIAKEI
jgi:2,4-dienoyl-CoA reductase-like NADH-dependent reductase (Old Yellow Enzyme family)/thioredoxin reductase